VKCPGTGLSPVHWDDVLGSTLKIQVRFEQMLTWEAIIPDNSLGRGVQKFRQVKVQDMG